MLKKYIKYQTTPQKLTSKPVWLGLSIIAINEKLRSIEVNFNSSHKAERQNSGSVDVYIFCVINYTVSDNYLWLYKPSIARLDND